MQIKMLKRSGNELLFSNLCATTYFNVSEDSEYMLVTEEVLAKMQDNFGPDVEVEYQGSVKTLGTL